MANDIGKVQPIVSQEKSIKKCIGLLALGLLTACAQQPLPIDKKPAGHAFLASTPHDRIAKGTSETVIRAYRGGKDDKGKAVSTEVAGAKCTLTSDHITAEVVTPQTVTLPKYDQDAKFDDRGVPPSILVSCVDGDSKGSALLTAKLGEIVSGSGNLLVDPVLITGSAIAASTAHWRYAENVEVALK